MTSTKEAILGGIFMLVIGVGSGDSTVAQEMERGFTATHSPTDAPFQPILSDPSGTFYLGFLRVGSSLLDLAVIHLPSSFPVWRATPAQPALWSSPASLSFNGSLLLAQPQSGRLLWSSSGVGVGVGGDRVVILASSDLQIRKDGGGDVAWQSFGFPADTVVQNQNFTSGMSLFSPGRRFTMHLGTNYFGLYFVGGGGGGDETAMYWRHTALEAKAQVQPGGAPLYMRVDPEGFLGMYQNGSAPVDVIAFNTFNRNMTGQFRRLTLEDDANLHAYYWSGTGWVGEYTAIADACEIPTTCGAYSVCRPGAGAGAGAHQCTCLANGTDGCLATPTGDFCGSGGGGTEFTVLRRSRVDLGNKEVMNPRGAGSVDDCEGPCARNCSCWGAIYSNATDTCYQVDYPVQLLLQGDQWHVGYFKVRSNGGGGRSDGDEVGGSKEKEEARRRAMVALLVVGSLILVAAAGFGAYKVWGRRRSAIAVGGEGLAPGPYKDLGKASFKSIEIELASSSSSSSPHILKE